jgi:hypothetical protein
MGGLESVNTLYPKKWAGERAKDSVHILSFLPS